MSILAPLEIGVRRRSENVSVVSYPSPVVSEICTHRGSALGVTCRVEGKGVSKSDPIVMEVVEKNKGNSWVLK